MNILVDTHAFLWFVFGDVRLSKKAERAISHPSGDLHISIASLWELAIKENLGKINLGRSYDRFVDEFVTNRPIGVLTIEIAHCKQLSRLPRHHGDPFDRLLVAQALTEGLHVLTDDPAFKPYGVKAIW